METRVSIARRRTTSQNPEGYLQGQAVEQTISNLLKNLNLGGSD